MFNYELARQNGKRSIQIDRILKWPKSDEFLMGGEGLGDLVISIGRGSKTGGRPKLEIVRGPL